MKKSATFPFNVFLVFILVCLTLAAYPQAKKTIGSETAQQKEKRMQGNDIIVTLPVLKPGYEIPVIELDLK